MVYTIFAMNRGVFMLLGLWHFCNELGVFRMLDFGVVGSCELGRVEAVWIS